MSDRHNLWVVYTAVDWYGKEHKYMAVLASGGWDEMQALWAMANKRADKRPKIDRASDRFARSVEGHERLEYLAVRDAADYAFGTRYTIGRPGRWSALLTTVGDIVRVTIYGNTYTGTVTSCGRLSAEVNFRTNGDANAGTRRDKTFPILPVSPFARGIQSLVQRRVPA